MTCIRPLVRLAVAGLALALLAPLPAFAQGKSWGMAAGDWSIQGGVGLTADPDGFLVGTSIDYALSRDFSVGPMVQLSFDDDDTIVAPTVNVRYRLDLSEIDNDFVRRIEPFALFGLGFAYIDKDDSAGDDDDAGFLIAGGFGADYWFTDDLAVGTNVVINGMPDDVVNEDVFVSFQLVSLRYRF